jgi:hypothetical protein
MNPLIFGVPFAAMIVSIYQTDAMADVMQRYDLLRAELRRENVFPMLWDKATIIGMSELSPDGVGYNVGKGYEIFICTKGSVNNIMHVLLHELAHNTVSEYDHSSKFWSNLEQIKAIAIRIGIYSSIGNHVAFCDSTIGD